MSCRDCKRCTEPSAIGCLLLPLRIIEAIVMLIPRSFKKKCRQCGHPLEWHARDDRGRFTD